MIDSGGYGGILKKSAIFWSKMYKALAISDPVNDF